MSTSKIITIKNTAIFIQPPKICVYNIATSLRLFGWVVSYFVITYYTYR